MHEQSETIQNQLGDAVSAAKIRSRIPELHAFREKYSAYNDLSDSDLVGMLAAKYPAYQDLPDRLSRETRYSDLAGGAEAKISAMPGYFQSLKDAFTAPFNQPRQEVGPYEERPGPLSKVGRSLLGAVNVINSPFEALARGNAKYAGEYLPVSGQAAETIGGATAAIAGNILPFIPAAMRGRASGIGAGARTFQDLIEQQRPGLPPPREVLQLPPPAGQRALPEPPMVMQGTAPLETPGGAAIASDISRAPKRTIVDLVDEIKQDIKDKVIQEISDELRTGRTAGMTRREAPKLLAPPEPAPTVAPGSTQTPLARVTPQPVPETAPAAAQAPASPKIVMGQSGYRGEVPSGPKFTESTPIADVLPPRIAKAAPKEVLNDAEVAMSTFIKRQGGVNIPKNLKEEFGGWNRLHNAKGLGADEMAHEAFDAGLLPEPTTAALLDSLKAGRKTSRAVGANQEINAMADAKTRELVNMDAPIEFKGKTYSRATREGSGIRLKDSPDKVITKAEDILQAEEKVPFDIPPEQSRPFDPTRLKAAVQMDDGEIIVGQAGRGGHGEIYNALSPEQQQRVAASGFVDPTDPNSKNFYKGLTDAEQAYNAREGIAQAPQAAPVRKVKGPNGELVEVPTPTAPADIAMTKEARPSLEQTPAGQQAVIPGTEGRTIPKTPLRPKRAQTETPMELEQPGIRAKEPGLFGPTIKEPPAGYGQGEFPQIRKPQTLADLIKTPEPTAKVSERLPARGDVIYARRTGAPINDVADVKIGDVVYDDMLGRYGKVSEKYKDAVRVQEGKNTWTIGAGNRLGGAEIVGQQGALDLPEGKRGLTGILKSEKGTIGSRETNPIVTGPRLAVGETIEQSGKTVRKTMGEKGNDLMDRLVNVRNTAETNTGMLGQPIEDALKKLKKADYENAVLATQGKAAPQNENVAEYVRLWKETRADVAARAKEAKLEIKNPVTGEYRPFTMREDYFPHYSKQELSKIVEDPNKRATIKALIKKQLEGAAKEGTEITDRQVEESLQAMIKATKGREGHLEIARVFDDMDYVKDPRLALKYIHDANRRIEIAKQFGPKLERGEELLTAIGQKHGDKAESFARTLFNRQLHLEDVPDTLAKSMMEAARNYNTFTMLGRAFIPNASQHVYTAIVAGYKNTGKAFVQQFTKEGSQFSRRAGVITDEVLKEFFNEATGTTGTGWLRKATGVELKPFTVTEKSNRSVAALAGRNFARETFDALKANPTNAKLRATLDKMNVGVDGALKRGALSEVDELKAAQNIVNRTQFKVDPMELPLFWSSPEGKFLTQFKSFNFKSGQFMKDEILKELAAGNIKPAARSAILLPAGHAVRMAQKLASGRPGLATTAEALTAVGVFGLLSDAFRESGRSGTDTLAGPTLSNIGRGYEAVSETGRRVIEGKDEIAMPLVKFAARQVPVIGPTISGLLSKDKRSEREKMIEELGLKRESDSRAAMKKQLGLSR